MAQVDIHAPGVEVKKTACYFCHQNCGVLAYVKDGDVIKIEGDPDYTNAGSLCCRGNIALKHLNHPHRVNYALKRVGEKGSNKWERIPYDQAIEEIAAKLMQIKKESGAEALSTIGGTTRTDDWARRRFMNFYGSPNSAHNALLCWIPTFMLETCVSGWSPFETDLGSSKCLILWGMNPGASTMPGMKGYTDLMMGGLKVILVDPRYSETAGKVDLWLPLRPGSDTALSLAMLHTIIFEGLYDRQFVDTWCEGWDELVEHMRQYTPEWAAPITWLSGQQIREAARMYANNKPGNIQWGCTWDQIGANGGAGSHARALMRAITGNLDCPGGDLMPGPSFGFLTDEELEANEALPEEQKLKQLGCDKFKLTSWPGYQKIRDTAIATWGKAPTAEWMCEAHGPSIFKSILTGWPYQTRALIVMSSNPMNSYGDSKMILAALKKVEFMVTVDYWMTPEAFYSDYVMPPANALERPIVHTNYGVTDSILCSQRAIQPKYDRHTDFDFWRLLGLACGQTKEQWPWETLEDAYFDIIKPLGYAVETYDQFVEYFRMYFPPQRFYKYGANGFCTPSRKVELKSSILEELGYPPMPTYTPCFESEMETPEIAKEYPITLTTGGGFMPYHHSEQFNVDTIRYLYPDPYFTINPHLADKLGIKQGDWCWIETRRGRIKQRADVQPAVDPRVVFAPRGWWFPEKGVGDPEAPFGCIESAVNVLTPVDDEACDPIGGSWPTRGLLCKVYKVGELEMNARCDTSWSIPSSHPEKTGNHLKPGEIHLAFDPIPYDPKPNFEVPEGLTWDKQRKVAYQESTGYIYDPETGWLASDEGVWYDVYSGYAYDPDADNLVDEATGKRYTLDLEEIGGGSARAARVATEGMQPLPEGCEEDESGWMLAPDGEFYDPYTGLMYDFDANDLVDLDGNHYDIDTLKLVGGADAPLEATEGMQALPDGCEEDEDGWMVAPDGKFYDPFTGLEYDFDANALVDKAGNQYDLETLKLIGGEAPAEAYEGMQEVPAGCTEDEDGWMISADGKAYDPFTGLEYDFDAAALVDNAGNQYDLETLKLISAAAPAEEAAPAAEAKAEAKAETKAEAKPAAKAEAKPAKAAAKKSAPAVATMGMQELPADCVEDEAGWMVAPDNKYYDIETGLQYDFDADDLVDKDGNHYDLDTLKLKEGVR